jgi:hypothetical protein
LARPRTPTNILEMRGAFRKNPARRADRENEPVVTEPLGEAPKTFTADQLQAWTDIVAQCPAGVLRKSDGIAVEEAARLLAMSRMGSAETADRRALHALIGKFGMTPSERSKVTAEGKPAKAGRFEGHG